MEKSKPFYMVFAEGQQSPTYRHLTYESAKKEAERLSETLGVKCYVLITISSHKCLKFQEEAFEVPTRFMDMPF